MSRLASLALAAALFAGAAQAQRLDVDPALTTTPAKPIPVRPGMLIASELSQTDFDPGSNYRSEQFLFTGRAGEVVTAQVRSDISTLEVVFREKGLIGKVLAWGPAKDAPIRAVLPKDGSYFLFVNAGKGQLGKYLLSLGLGDSAPPFEPPKPAPVQVAQAPQPSSPAPKPAPLAVPELPTIPGVVNIRTGQTLARPAGKPDAAVETFQFIAGAGAKLQATVAGTGPLTVRLYTPEGVEMLAADGVDTAKLEAFLPLDALYFLSVARSDPAKPYKLALAADEASLLDADFIHRIGYERLDDAGVSTGVSCWLEPGVKTRRRLPDGMVMTVTRLGGGGGRSEWTTGALSGVLTWETRIEGDELVRTTTAPPSPPTTTRYTPFSMKGLGAYRGYRCP